MQLPLLASPDCLKQANNSDDRQLEARDVTLHREMDEKVAGFES